MYSPARSDRRVVCAGHSWFLEGALMYEVIRLVLLLLGAVAVLASVARRLRIPYPIALVLGGLALALVPGLPRVQLDPDLIFLLFLPPLVYAAGWTTSLHDVMV